MHSEHGPRQLGFRLRSGETIAGATLWRAGDTDGGNVLAFYQFWLAGETKVFDPNASPV